MTQYNTLKVNLSNSQLSYNLQKKNGTKETLNESSSFRHNR